MQISQASNRSISEIQGGKFLTPLGLLQNPRGRHPRASSPFGKKLQPSCVSIGRRILNIAELMGEMYKLCVLYQAHSPHRGLKKHPHASKNLSLPSSMAWHCYSVRPVITFAMKIKDAVFDKFIGRFCGWMNMKENAP
jgi:hypothetical protein